MGHQYGAICSACQHRFSVSEGPGMRSVTLHCDRCGRMKTLAFEKLGERFWELTALGAGPYDLDGAGDAELSDRERPPREALRNHVETVAGRCRCRGTYRIDAPARCPRCRSVEHEPDPEGEFLCYD